MRSNFPFFKGHLIYVILLIVILVLFLGPIFHKGVYRSHDGDQLIGGIASMYQALADKQVPPRWSGSFNYSFGSPHLLFYYPLENYLGAFLHSLGFSFQDAYKVLIALSFILAPIFFYAWISQLLNREFAFLGALLYGLTPYRFADMFVRGSLGEMFAFTMIPLVFLFIEKASKKQSIKYIISGSVVYGLLILSHNILSLVFSFILFGYILMKNWSVRRHILSVGLILLLGLMLSAFFWIPALYESKYLNTEMFTGNFYKDHFLPFGKIIYSNWGFGDKVYQENGLSPYVGPVHFLLILIAVILLFKKMREGKFLLFWLVIFFISLFLALSFSQHIWTAIATLRKFQFPWRFIAVGSFASAVIGSYVFSSFKRKSFAYFTIVILIFISFPLARVNGYFNYPDKFYLSFPFMDFHGESTTIWTAGNASQFPKKPIEVIAGEGSVRDISKKSNEHQFSVDAKSELVILDNTVYFPGWVATIDGKKTPIQFQDINHRGLITFTVPEGIHNIKITFKESPIRLFSDIFSLSTLVVLLVGLLFYKRLNHLLVKLWE